MDVTVFWHSIRFNITAQCCLERLGIETCSKWAVKSGCLEEDSAMNIPIHHSFGFYQIEEVIAHVLLGLLVVWIFWSFLIYSKLCGVQALAFVNAARSDAETYGPFPNYFVFIAMKKFLYIRLQEVLTNTKVESMSRCCDHSIDPFTL